MNRDFILFLFGFGTLLLAAQQVSAQSVPLCGPRDAIADRLANRYGELRQSAGPKTASHLAISDADIAVW